MRIPPQDYRWRVIDKFGREHLYRNDQLAAGVAAESDAEMTIVAFHGDPVIDETFHSATAECRVCGETWRVEGGLDEFIAARCPACPADGEVDITYRDYHVDRPRPDDE